MNGVLLASTTRALAEQARISLQGKCTLTWIAAPDEFTGNLSGIDLVLLDQNFTEFKALDFLMEISSNHHIPVLLLTDPEDHKTAAEAMGAGAHNFLIKQSDYTHVLPLAVSEGIRRFQDTRELIETITQLKTTIKDLESKLKIVSAGGQGVAVPAGKMPKGSRTKETILTDVVNSLKSGEINLPSYPETSIKFKELLKSGASVSEISRQLSKDMSVSSRLISVANSAAYQCMVPIKTLEQAISRIGIAETRNYVELITNRSLYMISSHKYAGFLQELWMHSLATAYACQELCKSTKRNNASELFMMGLFHDIGKLLLTQIVDKLESSQAFDEGISSEQFANLVESSHGRFGECLIKKWKLGDEFACIAKHVDEAEQISFVSNELYMVCMANHIAGELGYGKKPAETGMLDKTGSAMALGLNLDQIEVIKNSVIELMEKGKAVG